MIIKRNFKQRLKSVQGLRSFKNTLPTTIKKIIIKKGKIYSKILENWKFIIGDELFSHCHPRSIKISNKVTDSCLSIMVLRGKEVDIEYSRNEILKKVNSLIGYEVVKKIKLVSFESNINENIKNINENIKKRSRPDSNWCKSFCRALPSHSATGPNIKKVKIIYFYFFKVLWPSG